MLALRIIIYVRERDRMERNREYRRIGPSGSSSPFTAVAATASSARDVRRWIHEYPSACPWKRMAEFRPRDRRRTNPGDGERRDAGQCGRQAGLGYTRIQASPFHAMIRAAAVHQPAGGATDDRVAGVESP